MFKVTHPEGIPVANDGDFSPAKLAVFAADIAAEIDTPDNPVLTPALLVQATHDRLLRVPFKPGELSLPQTGLVQLTRYEKRI